jgi:hypothetical protein
MGRVDGDAGVAQLTQCARAGGQTKAPGTCMHFVGEPGPSLARHARRCRSPRLGRRQCVV